MEEKAQNIFNLYKEKNLLEEVPEKQIEQYKKSCDNIFGKGMSESFLALAGNKKRKRLDGSRYVNPSLICIKIKKKWSPDVFWLYLVI